MATENIKNAKRAEYMRKYRREHPEYRKAQWTQGAVRLLRKQGYTVIKPSKCGKSLSEYINGLFDPSDPNCVGKRLLAEALIQTEAAIDEVNYAKEAAEAAGLKAVGIAEIFDDSEEKNA